MKKILFLPAFILFLATSCGPAAEDREVMHANAKRVADSMANLIQSALKEAESPPNVIVVPDTANKSNSAPAK